MMLNFAYFFVEIHHNDKQCENNVVITELKEKIRETLKEDEMYELYI